MTAFLIGERSPQVQYDRSVGQYRDSRGRFVPRATILKLVDEEAARLETRMKAHARLLTQRKIALPEFQQRAVDDLKLSHLRMTILASGGKSQISSAQYGATGRLLRDQYQYLEGFAQDLAAGKLSAARAIARAGMYGGSSRTAFHAAEKIARGREGFIEAKRSLDPGARHCSSCLGYSTNGLWVPLEQIVMPGVNCECFHKCRCLVVFRKR